MSDASVLLVGCGPMAVDYAKVLRALGVQPTVVGRGRESAEKFTAATGLGASHGGIEAWLADPSNALPTHAVVAVGERWIGATAKLLLQRGLRHVLLEKPGGHDAGDIRAVARLTQETAAQVYVGYNRRFYASVDAARRQIEQDGGVTSFNFEFTEWAHVIAPLQKEAGVKEQWFLANSTHVIDLAFHLGGEPTQLSAYAQGGLDWHPAASVFAGAGRAASGALFTYQANWEAPGRWALEVLTRKHRLIFRPLEKLQIQKIGSVAIDTVEIDDQLDKDFKPGLYQQVQAFLDGSGDQLPTIGQQAATLDWYQKIRGDV